MTPDDTVPDGYWDRLAEVAQAWPSVAPEPVEGDRAIFEDLGWT